MVVGTGLAHTGAAMDDAGLRLRIKVIRVSTRAAVHSLGPTDPQVADVVARGRWLLDDLARAVIEQGTDELRVDLEQARAELDWLDGGGEGR
ncbi:MAG: hypothetical protein ACRDE6_08285 [Candidatus Limnocylindria bacterium]